MEILESAPEVKLLVTSREHLNLRWEWRFEIEGLTYPVWRPETRDWRLNLQSPISNLQWSAVQLFVQRARRADWRFSASDEESAVVRICRLVEGMPLGIELAAAWVGQLPCRAIAQAIERNLDLLATTLRDMPPRHRSLRAAFDHSWDLLSEEERRVFRQLSVFRGGFQKEVAARVAGAARLILLALESKSLLRRTASGRYEMHELIRQYREEKLREVPEEREKIRDRHCTYYAAFLHQREGPLKGGKKQKEALEEIGEELENVRAGWQLAATHGKAEEIGKSLESLFHFYEIRNWFQEGEAVLGWAVERLRETNGMMPGEEKDVLFGKVLARQGELCIGLPPYGKARKLSQESLSIFRRLGARKEMVIPLTNLGEVAIRLGEYTQAKQLYQESLAVAEEIGDRWGIADSLFNLGHVAQHLGEYREAQQLYQQSLAISKEIGDRKFVALCLDYLGYVTRILGEYVAAEQLHRESLAVSKEIGEPLGISGSLDNLGLVAYELGKYSEAKQLFQQGLSIRREVGEPWVIAISLSHLGGASCAPGAYQESKKYFHKALKTAVETQAAPTVLEILVGMAALLGKQGQKEKALELLTITLHHPATDKNTGNRAECLLPELTSQLLPQVIAAAQERGRGRTLEEVAEEMLREKD